MATWEASGKKARAGGTSVALGSITPWQGGRHESRFGRLYGSAPQRLH